ncbi:MAG: sigma-70 family RNA polymerase sigma factor [Thermogemmatispora sp.]|uniref:sigma-70 family RNA polymerase sigma factor n=2 Tax=Thermogemmatispora sp. TaxID=1968838 RepID=UPI001DE91150|nr:sigma-70 family RNA polymerase sigma factor [Thermogemmatispora sp.]MBX5449973.1 sigma-70 family RNA polymerase sigma factor [Thermogemmatispora sp.]
MDSTLRASGTLSLGPAAQPARHIRRKRGSRPEESPEAISSRGQAQSGQGVLAGGQLLHEQVRGAAVEAISDTALVELVLAGEQEAFSVLVERYKDAVYNLAYRMLGNVTEAEDVTQEAFVRAYMQLASYKPAHKFSTWLLSIASHLAIDQFRRRRFLAKSLEEVPFLEWIIDLGSSPEQSALEGEQHDEIQRYLQRLPAKYRAVIVLRYWYDLSYEEIASALKLTPALVKARLHRARELLARYMQQEDTKEGAVNALPRR